MATGLEALIFDVDGTLADTEREGHRVAFNAAFAEAGLDWHWSVELYGELLAVTGGKERMRHYLAQRRPDWTPPSDLDALIKELHAAKTAHYVRMLNDGEIPLRTGVLRLLAEAREAGVRLAIATTTTAQNVRALLETAPEPGLVDWFEVIAAGDAVPRKKPAPDIFELALAQLDLPPSSCVAIEDSANGVRAALAAGLDALVVTVSPYTADEDFRGAPLVVDRLGEPGRPATALVGSLEGAAVVDLALLRRLRDRVFGAPA